MFPCFRSPSGSRRTCCSPLKGDLAGTKADGSDSGNKLSNIKAGQNYKGNTDEATVNAAVKDIVDTAKTSTTDSQKLAAIEKYVDLGSTPIKSVTKDSPATVAPGYYLIKDKAAGSVGDYDAYTLYIVKVAGNTTIERKVAVPTVEKKVKGIVRRETSCLWRQTSSKPPVSST